MRNGIWDRKLKPNLKTNIIASSIAAVLAGIICFSVSYRNYHKLIGSIATGIIMFVQVEILCLLVLMINADGFISDKASLLIICFVLSVNGQCMET